jgi:Ca2+-transporting ATPase
VAVTRSTPQEQSPLSGEQWYALAIEAVQARLSTGKDGLTNREAAQRLARFGPNAVESEREDPWWMLAMHQLRDPLIYILLFAAGVTLVLRDYTDTGVILAAVVLNGVIGFVQEYRARRAMRALARLSAPRAVVLRDGLEQQVASKDVVPGDVVVLASGSRVPADLRLNYARELEVDESALTGESVAVFKTTEPVSGGSLVAGDQTNMAFSGTVVTRGRGQGIVVRTGAQSELGRIASAMHAVRQTETPLQLKFERLGRRVALLILGLAIIVLAIGLMRSMPAGEIFLTAVAMAVSAIPEGLPVVLTVTLAVGARRMARRRAIIRSLPAVETLGSTTVIGSDKTGTLTKNEMTVRAIETVPHEYSVTGVGYAHEGTIRRDGQPVRADDDPALAAALRTAVLANEAQRHRAELGAPTGDPTEIALLVVAAKGGMNVDEVRARHRQLDVLPFESEHRFMASLNEDDGGATIHLKGAPEVILARCTRQLGSAGDEPVDAESIRARARALAADGLRVLATARRRDDGATLVRTQLESGFTFTGLLGMEDPPRDESVSAVHDARSAGIRVIMLTGDHLETARAIGVKVGLAEEGARAVPGQALDAMPDDELDRLLDETSVFARVAPEHKLRIVQRLTQRGEVVAVTGDGVNDAPALRAAHIGIAMGATGTDVAREAADMVLADDNFASITAAVEEGRIVFSNIRKVTFFLLSTAAGEVVAIITALLAGWPLPFTAAQILWINLVTDTLEVTALAFEPAEPGLLRQKPRPLREGVLTSRHVLRLAAIGALMAAGTLWTFWWTLRGTDSIEIARSAAVTQMVVFQFYHVFNCRSLDRSILAISPISNRFLFLSMVAVTAAHLAALYTPFLRSVLDTTPLAAEQWWVILAVGATVILGGEIDKLLNRMSRAPLG